jgi:SAM-dependent methyltransferase
MNHSPDFQNAYADAERARSYATLAFPGTYHLAFRDIPAILGATRAGARALDFGCGTGRSARFLRDLGYQVVGVDIAAEMLAQARLADPSGDYRLVPEGDLSMLGASSFDVALAAFTFDNIPGDTLKVSLLTGLRCALRPRGTLVLIVSTEELYRNEWASFSTAEFAGNRTARAGDAVYTRMLDVPDARPIHDELCPDEVYRRLFSEAGLTLRHRHLPLGRADEPFAWVNETRIAPWSVYELEPGPSEEPIARPR